MEITEIIKKNSNEIVKFIIDNPTQEKEVLDKLKMKEKPKWFEVTSILKDSKQNARGIGALTVEILKNSNDNSGVQEIDVNLLRDNPYQPRLEMNEESLEELMNDILKDGLQSPIKITPKNDGTYIIVFGHRRVAAHKRAGLTKIKCFIEEDIDDIKLRRLTLNENLKRVDLNLMELAISFKDALNAGIYKTQQELATENNIKASRVSEALSILNLQDRIIEDLKKDSSFTKDTTALALLNKITDIDKQWEVYLGFKDGKLSREDIKKLSKDMNENVDKKSSSQCETKIDKKKAEFYFALPKLDKTKQSEMQNYLEKEFDDLQKRIKEKLEEIS